MNLLWYVLVVKLCFYLNSAEFVSGKNLINISNNAGKYDLIRHRNRDDPDMKYCPVPATCEPLNINYTTCMGAKLTYSSTTLSLTGLPNQEKVHEHLQLFQYLRYVPNCWAVIQPFLCALYMPKCENNVVFLPSSKMCRKLLDSCQIFFNNTFYPKFFDCDNKNIFPLNCTNDVNELPDKIVYELKFNTTGFCMEPLIKTDQPAWFYPGIEGCGLRCKDSYYTENEHNQIQKLIGYCVLICGVLNLFTICTFIIDWTANKYPPLTIFYMNVCFFISTVGWSIQFLSSETREDIVCKKDGTLRKSEPSANENLSCVVVFVLVYYFLIACMVWFVIFSYTWYMRLLEARGKIYECVNKKRAYFHLIAWSLPLILTITTMALGEIDGDYVTGICFVGMHSFASRSGLLLTPLAAVILVAGYNTMRGLILLINVKIDTQVLISDEKSRIIQSTIVRMGVFTLFMLIFCIITFVYHGYVYTHSETWRQSLEKFIICKLTRLDSDFSTCKQESRPSVAILQLQLLAVFGAGITIASWCWCDATLRSWTRYIRRKLNCEGEDKSKAIPRDVIIRTAYAKRKMYEKGLKISVECLKHTDPPNLDIQLYDTEMSGWSDNWLGFVPRLIQRRHAICGSRQWIQGSEVNLNVRHVSIESRCNSSESQVSVQIHELKATTKLRKGGRGQKRHKRMSRDVKVRSNAKQESVSSLDSNSDLIRTLTMANLTIQQPNLNRREGNAGLDELLKLPDDLNSTENEEFSMTISESTCKYTFNKNIDFEDQILKNTHRIEKLNSGESIEKDSNSFSASDSESIPEHKELLNNKTSIGF